MKRLFCMLLAIFLFSTMLTGCWPRENPPTEHVVFQGKLYEITEQVAEPYDLDEGKLIEATVISLDMLPSKEGEVNAAAASAQIYDLDDTQFLVILDGTQYLVKK